MRRERWDDDCDAHRDHLAVCNAAYWEPRDRLHELVAAAHRHFPQSRHLRIRWVRARLKLGNRKPRVLIGCGAGPRFPRTMREATFL